MVYFPCSQKCDVIEDLYSEMESVHEDNTALRDDIRGLVAKNDSLAKSLQVGGRDPDDVDYTHTHTHTHTLSLQHTHALQHTRAHTRTHARTHAHTRATRAHAKNTHSRTHSSTHTLDLIHS